MPTRQKAKVVKSKTLTEKQKAETIREELKHSKIHKVKMPHEWHQIHLCYLANMGYQQQNSDAYKSLVRHPNYLCKNCGRVAHDKKNLCSPVKL